MSQINDSKKASVHNNHDLTDELSDLFGTPDNAENKTNEKDESAKEHVEFQKNSEDEDFSHMDDDILELDDALDENLSLEEDVIDLSDDDDHQIFQEDEVLDLEDVLDDDILDLSDEISLTTPSMQNLEQAIEKALQRVLSDQLEQLLTDIISKRLEPEIEKIKQILLKNKAN
jgi:hypothetical protein